MTNLKIAHSTKSILKKYFEFVLQIAKGMGWFINDIEWKYRDARKYSKEQCSCCFKLMPKGVNGGFDYKGHTYYICKDCYNTSKGQKQ